MVSPMDQTSIGSARQPATRPAQQERGAGVFAWFLIITVLVLGGLTLMLVRTNAGLRAQLLAAEQALARERTRDSLAKGDTLAPITSVRPDGSEDRRTFAIGKPTVVFLVAGKCPYCDETLPVWQQAIIATRAAEAGKVDLLTIQTDAKRSTDLRPLPPPMEARFVPQQAGTWLLRVPISPGALLVDGNGVVRRVWFGMPSEQDRQELVQALLGVLP